MKKLPWKTHFAVTVALGLLAMVVRAAVAGPQNMPNAQDKADSARTIAPSGIGDEQAHVVVADYIAGNGIVEPSDRELKVAGQVPGRLAEILVTEGERVEVGTAIAQLEDGIERAALNAAEADLEAANAELLRISHGMRREDLDAVIADSEGAGARAALSRDTLERIEQLAKGGAATPDELERARRQADADQRAFESLRAKMKGAIAGSRPEDIAQARAKTLATAARRDVAKKQLERLTVRAPIAGEILQLKFRVGEYYMPGSEPLATMGDTRVLRVRMDVEERDMARVALGDTAFATSNAFLGRRFRGEVVEIGKRMGRKNVRTDDPVERIDTKVLEVVILLEQRDELVPGLRVVGYIEPTKKSPDLVRK